MNLTLVFAFGRHDMRIIFMGTPLASVPALNRCVADGHEVVAVYTQPDRPAGRGNRISYSPVKQFALQQRLPVQQPVKIRNPEAVDIFRSYVADVTVVVAYGRILPESYLAAFSKGAVNVHFSLLPKYRGAAPVNWAIVNGEAETGVTTMQMDTGLDTGSILLQTATAIGATETAIELVDRLSIIGADVLSETLSNLDDIQPRPQDHGVATLAPIMKRKDGLIDWNVSGQGISNRVRGFQPFPTAFTTFRESRLTIWRACPVERDVDARTRPGEIVDAHGDSLVVTCGDGSLLGIEEVQPEGKRRMPVRDFVNGFHPQRGSVLG